MSSTLRSGQGTWTSSRFEYYRSVYIWHDVGFALACPSAGGRFTLDVKRDDSADAYLKERLSSDLGWTIEPIGLQDVLTDASMPYWLPLMITENGVAEIQDRNRAAFLVAHLQMILASIQSGCDVLGYVHWTIANDDWEVDVGLCT